MINLTKRDLAAAAGYTYRRLYDIDKTLPAGKKLFVETEDGKCSLPDFVQHWVEYNLQKDDVSNKTLEEVKAEHEVVKKRKTELEVATMEGSLVDINEIKKLWSNIAANVTQNLIRLPNKIAPQLVMMGSADVIEGLIDAEIRQILTEIADTPIPQNLLQETDEEQEQEE